MALRRVALLLISIFSVALRVIPMQAATYYVAPTGSDTNAGTSASPFRTIGHAAGLVNPGDTVIVGNGVYQEALNITRGGTAGAYVTFQSQNMWGAVLDGKNDSLVAAMQFTASYIRVQGFEVRNYGMSTGGGDAFDNYPGGQHIDIVQNNIHDIGRICTDTANGLVGIFLQAPYVTIEQNFIHDIGRLSPGENGCNPAGPYYQNHDHGVYVDSNSNNVTIRNNIFYRIGHGYGIQIYPDGVDSLAIVNNTFIWPNPYRVGNNIVLAGSSPVTNLRIENNISYNPTTAMIHLASNSGFSGTVANNIIFNGSVIDVSPSGLTFSGNQTNTDPLLVNAGDSTIDSPVLPDAHLRSGSPAIGAGLTLADVTTDYAGSPRTSPYDIGAYKSSVGGASLLPPTNLRAVVH